MHFRRALNHKRSVTKEIILNEIFVSVQRKLNQERPNYDLIDQLDFRYVAIDSIFYKEILTMNVR